MIPAIDTEYDELLHAIQPKVIHNKREYARLSAEVERLMLKGDDNLSVAESAILELIFDLVRDYEQKNLPPRQKSAPAELLKHLMEQTETKAADLPLPPSRASEILKGKRTISKAQAIDLGEFFNISPALFLEK